MQGWYSAEIARLETLSPTRVDVEATRATELLLTDLYGEEIRNVIEDFEIQWYGVSSLDETTDLSKIATGPYLDVYGITDQLIMQMDPNSVWPIVTSARVRWIQVAEYSPERFKAIATVDWVYDRMTPQKEIVHSDMETQHCRVYVFVREHDRWKLAGLFNTTRLTRDSLMYQWNHAPEWLKAIIGDLPNEGFCKQ